MPVNTDFNAAIEAICGHFAQRTAVLFLGAGVNHGVKNQKGESFPLGGDLAQSISKDLLSLSPSNLTLQDAAEIARYDLGKEALNEYLFTKFSSFVPDTVHLAIAQLPWDVIYTTNYDLLIENAFASPSITPAGKIQAVCCNTVDLTRFTEEDIIYYKLHGSIDIANTSHGRLILTKDDYRHYEHNRKPLFVRLGTDLLRKTMVFIGYSFADDNFRGILEDCRNELGSQPFPLSYAIRPNFTDVEAQFWKDKYNIVLIQSDAFTFLTTLKDSWNAENRKVLTFEERRTTVFAQSDESTRFPQIGDSFYRIVPSECNAPSDAKLFFRGAQPSWADIRDQIPPTRDAYVPLMEGLFGDFADATAPLTVYLVTGHAGVGKTTLIRTVALEISKDYHVPVLVHIPGTPLDARLITPLAEAKKERIVVVIHHAADYVREIDSFVDEIRRRKLPVSLILEERKNQWITKLAGAGDFARRFNPAEIEIGSLSPREINSILVSLEQHHCLGRLEGTPREVQEEHFTALAQKELLVALRELTVGGSFDDIIRDEYERIPSEIAQLAYVYVAALGQIHLPLRYEVLGRILHISSSDLGKTIFRPADGILVDGEVVGDSRHNGGFRLSTRHPVIASIIFALAAGNDAEKFRIVSEIIAELDPGFPEDRRLLEGIVKRKELVNTLSDLDMRRDLYDTLEKVLPNSAFVLQHRSILEREMKHADKAVEYARRAVSMERRNPALLNTLGMALEYGAREMENLERRSVLVNEANRIFLDGIARNPADAYSYIGRVNIIKYHELELEQSGAKKDLLRASAISLLEEAHEATGGSSIISTALAEQKERLGDTKQALKTLTDALQLKPEDSRLRGSLISLLSETGEFKEALKIAQAGVKFDPNSWRLQRHVARLMKRTGYPVAAIRSAYEAALRHKKDDTGLYVETAAFLFMSGAQEDARDMFSDIHKLRLFTTEKRQVREWWYDPKGGKKVFTGRITSIQGVAANVLAIPESFEAFFWRTENWMSELREGDSIQYQVGFNAYGPVAKLLIRNFRR